MKIAVIGSGAAAVGVLRALEEWCVAPDITIIDRGENPLGDFDTNLPPGQLDRAYLRDLYGYLRRTYGFRFPPPKTNFGLEPARRSVADWGEVWDSRSRGGLTNFWGASALPFTDAELRDWPLTARDLAPYYARLVEQIGVCGSDDALSDYFGQGFVNRPPIHRPWVFGQLEEVINRPFDGEGSYALTAGSSRLAVETRDDRDNRCIHCGACMTGCANQAIYSAGNDIGRYQAQGLIRRTITGKALTVRGAPPEVVVQKNGAHETVGPFDRVYVAAGCIGSTEIVMRSLDLRDGPLVTDNAVYTFPILYLGRHCGGPDDDDHYGLTNLLIGCRPSGGDGRFAMIQVYPNIDYLWRYFLPVALWPIAQPLGRALRRRLLWGRVFLDEAYSQRYAATMSDDGAFALRLARPPEPLARIPGLWASIRRQIGRRGFMLPKVPPVRHATSSHYAASLPLGSTHVDGDGRFGPDAYVCDSAVFPDGPAASLTLTIMALACRIAHRSLPGVI